MKKALLLIDCQYDFIDGGSLAAPGSLPVMDALADYIGSLPKDVYSHIIDEDRRHNAELFEEAFYGKKNLNPQIHESQAENMVALPAGINADLLAKVLANPEMAALLTSLAKAMEGKENI